MLGASNEHRQLLRGVTGQVPIRLVFGRVSPKARDNPEGVVTDDGAKLGGLAVGVEPGPDPDVEIAHARTLSSAPSGDRRELALRRKQTHGALDAEVIILDDCIVCGLSRSLEQSRYGVFTPLTSTKNLRVDPNESAKRYFSAADSRGVHVLHRGPHRVQVGHRGVAKAKGTLISRAAA